MKTKILFTMLVGGLLATTGHVLADDDERGGWFDRFTGSSRSVGVAPATDSLYLQECGACHFAYQPGLLPQRSWRKLMSGLEDHFGDNAELPPADLQAITDYLVENAADDANFKRSRKIMRSLSPHQAPLRITETPYLMDKHDEVPSRLITANPEVKSLSNCTACHTRAHTGSYSEREIDIPGFGRWED
jgi:hypothetical protein